MTNDKDKMHPEDFRNLIIFAIASVCIWFLYETYILKPHTEALKKAKEARAELALRDPEILKPLKFLKRKDALEAVPRVAFKNGEVSGTISLKGGRFDDLSLEKYYTTLEKKEKVILFSPEGTKNSRYADYGWVSADKTLKLPDSKTVWSVKDNDALAPELPVVLQWDNGQGQIFERIFSLDDKYVFQVTEKVTNNSDKQVDLYPFALVSQTGIPNDFMGNWMFHEGPMGVIDRGLVEMRYDVMHGEPTKTVEAQTGWIGISDKYWLTALIPQQNSLSKFRFKYLEDAIHKERSRYQVDFTGDRISVPAKGGSAESAYHLYAGAKKVFVLEEYERSLNANNLDLAVDFGWFWFLTYPFFFVLHYLGLWVGNMGVAIILMTVVLRGAVYPFSRTSYRSFAKMKVVAPRLAELREMYGDDKEKLQAEIVELYQKEGVNPMSGCLPIIAQIPIFFAFYKTIFVTIEIRHAPFFGWIQDLSAKDPTSVFNLFGLLPFEVYSFLHIGVWPCLMLVAMLVQKQLNPPPQDKIQKDMMVWFPFMLTYIMASFASGLVIYWTVSAALGVVQQSLIMRSMGVPIYFLNKDKFDKKIEQQVEEGPSVHPLIEMAVDEAGNALLGSGDSSSDTPPEITPPKPRKKKKKS